MRKVTQEELDHMISDYHEYIYAYRHTGTKANFKSQPHFEELDLSGLDFTGADLENASFMESDCTGANFKCSNLIGARFDRSILENANFEQTNCRNAHFRKALCKNTNFLDAEEYDLTYAIKCLSEDERS